MNSSEPFSGKQQNDNHALTGVCVLCAEMISHQDDTLLHKSETLRCAYGVCNKCLTAHITVEIENDSGSTSVSVLTDWKPREADYFWKKGSIQTDDMLALHEAIQSPMFEAELINHYS